ncbi:MAG: hypothetical protein EA409_00035 [Saprospirales bacterium]|nr:MAG: hypothetical protein EA409_00035 [Saprospirales bacterium]
MRVVHFAPSSETNHSYARPVHCNLLAQGTDGSKREIPFVGENPMQIVRNLMVEVGRAPLFYLMMTAKQTTASP